MSRTACIFLLFVAMTGLAQAQVQKRGGGGDSAPRLVSGPNDLGSYPWYMTSTMTAGSSAQPAGAPGRSGATTVSVTELQIPAAAMKELQAFQEKFAAGKMAEAAKHVEKAIHIFPQLAGAHHDLGLCYAQLSQYDKAAAEFQSAAELDDRLVQPRVSLAEVYLLQKKYAQGEAAARSALDLDPANALARYFLGTSMVLAGHDTPEAMELLRKSRDEFPEARLVLSDALLKHNQAEEAVQELRAYLEQPNAPGKDKVACAVKRLTTPAGSSVCSAQ